VVLAGLFGVLLAGRVHADPSVGWVAQVADHGGGHEAWLIPLGVFAVGLVVMVLRWRVNARCPRCKCMGAMRKTGRKTKKSGYTVVEYRCSGCAHLEKRKVIRSSRSSGGGGFFGCSVGCGGGGCGSGCGGGGCGS
jgi:hypothetical protein